MGIKSYHQDEKVYWKVYVNLRSKENSRIRKQKSVSGLESLSAARRMEKQVIAELSSELTLASGRGLSWSSIIDRWEKDAKSGLLRKYDPTTIMDTVSGLRRWTKEWLEISSEELTRFHGRELQKKMELAGMTSKGQKKVRSMVNTVFNYGLEEKFISKPIPSPVAALIFNNDAEKVPDILTLGEIKQFLERGKELQNEWYPIWAMALLTGMRNGELYALEWSDIDFENSLIRVSKSYNSRLKIVKSTKAGYWRNIPISSQLRELLIGLKSKGMSQHVLPRLGCWNQGLQAQELRMFLKGIGIRPVKFHALRACFATQLLAKNIAPAIVMKICGWKNLKTMEIYVRLAGVNEAGATECLEILPMEVVMENVVSLYNN